MATATKPYTPTITEAQPTTEQQRELAAQGFRGFWVEAKSKRLQSGVRIVRYLLTVMPSGYIKCPCEAHKWSTKDCCHQTALKAHLSQFVRQEAAPVQMPVYGVTPAAAFDDEEQGLADSEAAFSFYSSLLDRDTPDDEWTEVPAEEIAEIERRVEAMRAETQAEIERESARRVAAGQAPHPYSATFACTRERAPLSTGGSFHYAPETGSLPLAG